MAEEKNEELQTEETEQTKVEDGHGDSAEQEETENNSGSEVEEQEEPEVHPLEIELNELKDRLARVRADYENFRRRTKEEKEAQAKYAPKALLKNCSLHLITSNVLCWSNLNMKKQNNCSKEWKWCTAK